jgi:hypothetical protein
MRGPAAAGGAVDVREGKMNRRVFASIAAVFGVVNAVPGLVAPAAVASLYGVSLDSQSALAAQLLAASYIGYAVVNWITHDSTEIAIRRGIGAGNLIAWGPSAVIWISAASSGTANALGWVGAGFAVAFTVGWAYFVFADRRIGTHVLTVASR